MRELSRSGLTVGYLLATLFGASATQSAFAQSTLFAYPASGQSQEKQSFDRFECHQWSVQQTGFDPTRPAEQPQQLVASAPPPDPNRGGTVRGAAGGAAVGAIGGAIAGDVGTGAAVGAGVGAIGGTVRRNRAQRERAEWEAHQKEQQQAVQQDAEQRRAQQQQAYDRAWSACMSARNYQIQ